MYKRKEKSNSIIARAIFVLIITLAIVLSSAPLYSCYQIPANEEGQNNKAQSGKEAQGSQGSVQYHFTDDLGYEVNIKSAECVVACMGSFANIWELAGGSLVGVTDDAIEEYGLDPTDVQLVGSFTSPNLELIIALEPDFVIMTGASTGKDGTASQVGLREGLKASGIEVAYFNVTTFDDYLRMLEVCCEITGQSGLYELNGSSVQKQINDIRAAVPRTGQAPTVLLMTTYSGGTRVQNSSTMTGAMLAELGAINLADEYESLLRDFSLESVIELNPDFILVVPMGNDSEAAMKNLEAATAANPAWAGLDAVKSGRYITLDIRLFFYKPNADWGNSYQTLFDILYS